MTLTEFLNELAQAGEGDVVRLSPGPFSLKLGRDHARAAQILQDLHEKVEPDTTLAESEGVLIYNFLQEMKQTAEQIDDVPVNAPGFMAMWLRLGHSRAFLTAWWWLVLWSSLCAVQGTSQDQESKEAGDEQIGFYSPDSGEGQG